MDTVTLLFSALMPSSGSFVSPQSGGGIGAYTFARKPPQSLATYPNMGLVSLREPMSTRMNTGACSSAANLQIVVSLALSSPPPRKPAVNDYSRPDSGYGDQQEAKAAVGHAFPFNQNGAPSRAIAP
jgi:hypothetical protein